MSPFGLTTFESQLHPITHNNHPEVVLAILLRSFKFSLSSQEIVWNLAGIKYPTVGRDSTKPSMPIKVERV